MAKIGRPKKAITFFKRDLDMTNDSRMRKVLRQYGGLSVAVYEEVLSTIYETGSYYLAWTDDYVLDIADRLYESDHEKIRQIVGKLIEVGLFSKEIFDESAVLTSHGIQERYLERIDNVSHRKNSLTEFALICDNLRELSPQKPANESDKRDFAGVCDNLRDFAGNCPSRERERVRDKSNSDSTSSLSYNTKAHEQKNSSEIDSSQQIPGNFPSNPPRIDSDAHSERTSKNNQITPNGDSRGNSGDSMEPPDSDPVQAVVNAWNERFKGTTGAFEEFYLPEMLRVKISERLKTDDLTSIKKVFDYAKFEFDEDRKNNRTFIWTLPVMFSKKSTYERTKEKSERYQRQQLGNQRAVMGYSNPETYASAEEWANFGKEIGTKYATVR